MAASDRQGSTLSERLEKDSPQFSFFQLVQLLLRQHPGAPAPGFTGPASGEKLRFRPSTGLGFPASDVESVEQLDGGRRRLTVHFMGLYGPASPLPTHFSEDILWAPHDQQGARDFIDLFHHRMISLLYRSWEKYRHPYRFDRSLPDEVTSRMLSLMGVGTEGMREATGLALVPLLRTAGALASRHRSAAGLEGLIAVQFGGVAVRVTPCERRRVRLPDRSRLRLGGKAGGLGGDAILGERVVDRSGAFRVTLGPLDIESFRKFLPEGEYTARLQRLLTFYVPDPLDVVIELVLRGEDVPALRLMDRNETVDRLPLARLSWLTPAGADDGRVVIRLKRSNAKRARDTRTRHNSEEHTRSGSPVPADSATMRGSG